MASAPSILYHYTSLEAFRKILESEIVRATHYSELADWSEIQMGREIVARSAQAVASSFLPETVEFLARLTDALAQGELPLFVFSLSEERDSLDQWRAYCPGGGVAVGFMGSGLDVHFRKESKKTERTAWAIAAWELVQCQYHAPDESIDVTAILSNVDDFFKQRHAAPGVPNLDILETLVGHSSFSMIEQACCSMKHRAYASEKEWRCFVTLTPSTPLEVQLDDKSRRFVEMPFVARDVIKKVVLSPHGDKAKGRRLAEFLRRSKELSYETVESKIPFRA